MGTGFSRITCYDDVKDESIWSLQNNLTYEFTIGALLAGNFALNTINPDPEAIGKNRKRKRKSYFTVTQGEVIRYSWDVIDESKMEKYTIGDSSTKNIDIRHTCEHAVNNQYNVWLKDVNNISLYSFTSSDFMQGIFMVLKLFNISYKDMIIACPIKIISPYYGNRTAEYLIDQTYPLSFIPTNEDEILDQNKDLVKDYALFEKLLNSNKTSWFY